ncbi:hypothetical protein [Rhizorhabdus argentea]|uniref:hypothetical protein n=1 Tax=Rhizorhabdus argentea TaxID=1387174 RepID=UPI0030EC4DA9
MPTRDDSSEDQRRVAQMLEHLGLTRNGRPVPGAPGSLLVKPAGTLAQRPNSEQPMSVARNSDARVATTVLPRPAELKRGRRINGPQSLPKMLFAEDAARNLELARDRMAGRKTSAAMDSDFRVAGRRTPEQLQWQRESKQRAAYEKLRPDHMITDIAGKLWASPYTAVGAAAGALNVLAGRIAGRPDARITIGNNALQFEGGLVGKGGSAFTLGNSVLYGPGTHPDRPALRDDKAKEHPPFTFGSHEKGHTYQYGNPWFPYRYAAGAIRGVLTGKPNPAEVEADDFAQEDYRRARR